ncbi:hypothetical protein GS528_04775 [Rhodococcus hoagii]|nr:hypothetical protein [Prescottella equi]
MEAVLTYIRETRPDQVIHVGDVDHRVLAPLREIYSGPVGAHRCGGSDLSRFDVEQLAEYHRIAPGWATTSGQFRDGGRRPGAALTEAKRVGLSLVMGATHNMASCTFTVGFDENARSTTGLEVGHLTPDHSCEGSDRGCKQGFCILSIDGSEVSYELAAIHPDGRITICDREWIG